MKQKSRRNEILTGAYRILLALYPQAFRAEFGEEMQDVFTSALEAHPR